MRLIMVLQILPLILRSADDYVGQRVCAGCHADKFNSLQQTGHVHALAIAPDGSPGRWAFGAGMKAITYVSQFDRDSYVEHGRSYYPGRKALGITPGHANSQDRRYRTFDPLATALRCFRCHSTGPLKLGAGHQIEPFELGVTCESCHGPGQAHVKSGGAIFNPKRLSAVELNEFCGICHRKAEDISDWSNSWNVRHQPAYLTQSACFRKSNGAISCLTCHDPHAPLVRVAAEYGKRCSSCHTTVRHRIALAGRSCVDCHMPQVRTNAELRFTNHWIGIYDARNPLVPIRRSVKILPPPSVGNLREKVTPPADPASFRPLFEQVLAEKEQNFGATSSELARSASDLGLFLKSIGENQPALAPLQRALEIDRRNDSSVVPSDEENVATVLAALDRSREASELLQAAAQGEDAAVAARSLSTLAMLDPSNAERYYRQAVKAEEQASGKNDPQVAVLLNNLALSLRARDDNVSAEPLFRRALAIQEEKSGPNHPSVASTLNNLGSLLQSTGRLEEAERVERRALRIFEQKLGPQTAELATTCSNLADLLWARGARADALAFYKRALGVDESVYGRDHPEVAGDLTNQALLLKEMGQRAAAEQMLSRALAIYEKSFGPSSQQAMQARENLKAVRP